MKNGIHSDTAALVIGGTQGLGLAIATRLVAEGCSHIVIAGRNAPRGQAAAHQIGASFISADLEDTGSILSLVDRAAEQMGRINALVNAGAMTDRGSVLDTSQAEFDRMMTANLRSPFFAIQRVSQLAIAAGKPAAILNILSMVTHCGQSFLAPYSASKAALANVTKNAANTLRSHRIRVNGINCGWMDTPGEDAVQKRFHNASDDWLERAEAQQPFKMLVKPDHVAGLASYMLSDEAGVMTGSLVDFDQNVAGAYPES
ncbi:SDR family oxidoreductase [Pseudorhodobacter wandonensis]|jgi:NAD(P)-dependent dehydrogenase (short-subunit alcohol dehydrogenase family)|uniref:SDR family oxidoreductase n=1 Tax=Pseudorhodobacter wandonensis TaxID=1120568 RepID=UPI00067C03B8|nr:SDR family oxidoreductase [Pseudorhodobacter wandonensis]